MQGYSQNDSILGAPKREIIPYHDYLMGQSEPLTMADLYRQKSQDKPAKYTNLSLMEDGRTFYNN